MRFTNSKAFTLIELLVVISIIGVLSSIVFVNIRGAREKALIAKGLQFSSQLQSTNEAAAVYTFDDDTAKDTSGLGNNGTIYGATPVDGLTELHRAMSFDGINDYVSVPNSSSLNITNAITIEAWVKPASVPATYSAIVGKRTGAQAYSLEMSSNNGIRFSLYSPSFHELSSDNSVWSINNWYHIVGTYNGITQIIYLNGLSIKKASWTGSIATSIYNVGIGSLQGGGASTLFRGSIDEVRIYNGALTSAEIQQHYAEGLSSRPIAKK